MNILLNSLYITIYQVFAIIFILTIIILFLNFIENMTLTLIGNRLMFIYGFIGVPIHELTHIIFCLVFKHKINKLKLINFNTQTEEAGYVEHSYNKFSIYNRIGNIFIGLSPIILGGIILIIILNLFFPGYIKNNINYSYYKFILDNVTILKQLVMNNWDDYKFWILIYISSIISIHLSVSKNDLLGIKLGALSGFILIYIINDILLYFNYDIIIYNNYIIKFFIGLFIYIIFLSIFNLIISTIIYCIEKLIKNLTK